MSINYVTVATERVGLFDNLINNPYKKKIDVVGMNKKWTGFRMKFILLKDYISLLNDNDIVVYIDGYDSLINKNFTDNEILSIFKMYNCGILFSQDRLKDNQNKILKYGRERLFYKIDNLYLSCGLFMGYVKYLKIICDLVINSTCEDDQRIISKLAQTLEYIKIDYNNVVFENINKGMTSKAMIVSHPGNISFTRLKRAPKEYGQFFIKETIVLILLINLIILYSKKYYFLLINLVFLLHFYKMDKSCIKK